MRSNSPGPLQRSTAERHTRVRSRREKRRRGIRSARRASATAPGPAAHPPSSMQESLLSCHATFPAGQLSRSQSSALDDAQSSSTAPQPQSQVWSAKNAASHVHSSGGVCAAVERKTTRTNDIVEAYVAAPTRRKQRSRCQRGRYDSGTTSYFLSSRWSDSRATSACSAPRETLPPNAVISATR